METTPMDLLATVTPARVFVLDTQSGAVVRSAEHEGKPTDLYAWVEGNNSCDCNRQLFWERGNDPACDGMANSWVCTSGRYTVALVGADGAVLFSDMPEGWAPPQ
jgi:hypothetical protein